MNPDTLTQTEITKDVTIEDLIQDTMVDEPTEVPDSEFDISSIKIEDPIFDHELLGGLVEDFYVESDAIGEAKLTEIKAGEFCLSVFKYNRAEECRTLDVYIFPPAVFPYVDNVYRKTLRENSSGSDFWDMWNSLIGVLEFGHHVVTETFSI